MKYLLSILVLVTFNVHVVAARPWWKDASERPLLALPVDIEQAKADWEINGENLSVEEDDILKRTVFRQGKKQSVINSKQTFDGELEITALVRHAAPNNQLSSLQCGVKDVPGKKIPYTYALDFRLRILASPWQDFYPRIGAPLHALTEKTKSFPKSVLLAPRFPKISPVWKEDYRQEIEEAMAVIPSFDQTWFRVTILLLGNRVEMYRDSLLIAQLAPTVSVNGRISLTLQENTCLADLSVRRLGAAHRRYVTVPFSGKINANSLGKDGSVRSDFLPTPEDTVFVRDVPFRFPRRRHGADHLDIGTSFFHARLKKSAGNMQKLWPNATELDGGRLTLALPNRPYGRIWLIAAANEGEHKIPMLTIRFYRPKAGLPLDFTAQVPAYTARNAERRTAVRLPVALSSGKRESLWLIPVELDSARLYAEFRNDSILHLEVTKQVFPYRAFPDPCDFSSFQGGKASAVQLYAMTLEEAPVSMVSSGDRDGNLYVLPEKPTWELALNNLRDAALTCEALLTVIDPYGKEETVLSRRIALPVNQQLTETFPIRPLKHGRYQVRTELKVTSGLRREKHSPLVTSSAFVQFPEDTRRSVAKNSRWGLWCWLGAHGTNPDREGNLYNLRALGARYPGPGYYACYQTPLKSLGNRKRWGVIPSASHVSPRGGATYSNKEEIVPKEEEKHIASIKKEMKKFLNAVPDLAHATYFTEAAISMEATYGTYPSYNGESNDREWTEAEEKRIRSCVISAKATFKAIREAAPKTAIGLGWCHPQFAIPFMREGFPKESFDFFGVDTPTFQRTPEMPPIDIAPAKLWFLKQEMKRHGYEDKEVVHLESYFLSNNPLALGKKKAADHIVRLSVLSLAMGSDKLLGCFSLHNCSDYWGSQHYGGVGVIDKQPGFNPLPGAAAYGTMTRMLDQVTYDGFVETGSLSTFCLKFKNLNGTLPWRTVYCLWTVKGARDLNLTLAEVKERRAATLIDLHGNETPLNPTEGNVKVGLTPSPIWITSDAAITGAVAGPPAYKDAPSGKTVLLDGLNQVWTCEPGDVPEYSQVFPTLFVLEPAAMDSSMVDSPGRGKGVWQVRLGKQEQEKPLTGWFAAFSPLKPVQVPGKAKALGLRVNGKSNWGRIVYEIRDAGGETFLSCGSKNQWNCNDEHQLSYFSHDGWRYVEFPLPNNLAGDCYREKDNCWWGSAGDGVVDLPISLTRIIIQHRTHNVYADKMVRCPDPSVQLSDLMAVYDCEEDMTEAPILAQSEAMIRIASSGKALPNPHIVLLGNGAAPPPAIERFSKPEKYYDGSQIMVHIKPVADVNEYRVYVSAYKDGRGAAVMVKGKEPSLQVNRLRPATPLYFFATTIGKDKKESKPSAIRRLLLANDFPNK